MAGASGPCFLLDYIILWYAALVLFHLQFAIMLNFYHFRSVLKSYKWLFNLMSSFTLSLTFFLRHSGDLWSGSESGVIKIWPWESMEKSLSLTQEERHMAALLVERSFIDLRSQVTVNGVCNISSSDVKCLVSDKVRAKVWCATAVSFSLWYFCPLLLMCIYIYSCLVH